MFIVNFLFFALSQPKDPLYDLQFNINNNGDHLGIAGEDIQVRNITEASQLDGKGVPITVIDDGCYRLHADLSPHFDLENSFNYRTYQNEPFEEGKSHGTIFAGIAAGASNDVCGVGVANNADLRCFNLNTNFSNENLIDSIKRNNVDGKPQIKVFGSPFNICENNICNHIHDAQIESALSNAPDSVIFIASAGKDAALGGDSNFHSVLQHPRVIVVADSNNRGARSAWTNRGSNILVTATAGGSSSLISGGEEINYPSLPGPSIASPTSCANESDPIGSGAASVAGVVALLLQKNPKLNWRQIQAILALTSKINDFNHPSWTQNGAKNPIAFSHVYGFGRIDASLAVSLSDLTWPPQTFEEVTNTQNCEIPTMRRGSVNKEFVVGTKVKMVEYVVLKLTLKDVDYSTLRIQLKSPRGTVANVKFCSISPPQDNNKDHNGQKTYYYTIRNYFGASPEGTWKLHLNSDGIGRYGEFVESTISVYGTSQEIAIPHFQKNGTDPYKRPTQINPSFAITIADKKPVTCGSNLNLSITSEDDTKSFEDIPLTFTMTDSKRNSRWPIVSKPITARELKDIEIGVPCYFQNDDSMIIFGENSKEEIWGESEAVKVQNNKAEYILLLPNPYKTFFFEEENESIEISLVPTMNMKYWIDGAAAQRALVALYDMQKHEVIFRQNVVLSSVAKIVFQNAVRCKECILSVALSWHYPIHDCSQMIQPISILKKGEVPDEPFAVPLNDRCPIPEGIKVEQALPTPSKTPNPPKSKILSTIVGVGFLVLFAAFLVAFFVLNRNKGDLSLDAALLNSKDSSLNALY